MKSPYPLKRMIVQEPTFKVFFYRLSSRDLRYPFEYRPWFGPIPLPKCKLSDIGKLECLL
jgi:hypothetical protein